MRITATVSLIWVVVRSGRVGVGARGIVVLVRGVLPLPRCRIEWAHKKERVLFEGHTRR